MASFEYFKPLGNAWDRMASMLFRPFEMDSWLKLGFFAWLCYIFQGASINVIRFSSNIASSEMENAAKAGKSSDLVAMFMHPTGEQLALMIGIGLAIALLLLAIELAFLWIRCRGRFIFIHGIVKGPDIRFLESWRAFSKQGNSLFLLTIVWSILKALLLLPPLALAVYFVVINILGMDSLPQDKQVLNWVLAGVSALMLLIFAIGVGVLQIFMFELGAIHMYRNGSSAWTGAMKGLGFAMANPAHALLYLLSLICIAMAISAATIFVVIATIPLCCIGCILLNLPYAWAVVLLPAFAFRQLFTIEFIAQAGEEFQLFATQEERAK